MQYANELSGWLCLDKPAGISSNFAMVKVRRILKERTGYIGTLDPFATGVLPIAVGEARKFIQYADEVDKKYVCTMVFGSETDTLDCCGEEIAHADRVPTSASEISKAVHSFLGCYEQVPPIYSAIKINGTRACDRARRGEDLEVPSREVTIKDIQILDIDLHKNETTISVTCSKGTYIRSLVRDIAERLGSLAYVKSLRREQSGFFSIKNAITLEKLIEMKDTNELIGVLLPLESPLDDIPALYVKKEDANRVQNGLTVALQQSGSCSEDELVRIFEQESNRFRGIGKLSEDGVLSAARMCIDANKGE